MQKISDLVDFAPLAQEVAKTVLPPREVDGFGCDRDDYAAEFAWRGAEAREQFCNRYGFCTPAERRYVAKSMWNAARMARRKQVVHGRLFVPLEAIPEPVDDFEARMEARDLVRRLEQRLSHRDFEVLTRVSVAGGIRAAWNPAQDECCEKTFRGRVSMAKQRAREVAVDF
jgi:hypothetical protein